MEAFKGYHSEWNLVSPGGWEYQRLTQIIGQTIWKKLNAIRSFDVQLDFNHPMFYPVVGFANMLVEVHRAREGQNPGLIAIVAEEETLEDVTENRNLAKRLNQIEGITGVLMAKGGVFFQIIEGPEENIDKLFSNILKDTRHEKVITLGVQVGDLKRLFPNWHMKEINLDTTISERLQPVRAIIDAVHAQSIIVQDLTEALATAAWAELLDLTTKE